AKSIWITEYDWRIGNVDEATQAVRLQNALNELIKREHDYVTVATWLSLTDIPQSGLYGGLLRSDLTARPSFDKFKQMAPRWARRVAGVRP
ncbi:MAG: hypothetical protein HYY04_01750, partial [Chloroflexi bacterium]|nr:hypothetical protein [Chloroflexota bacterium]